MKTEYENGMLTELYHYYFDDNGGCRRPQTSQEEVYDDLTSVPHQQGSAYFNQVDNELKVTLGRIRFENGPVNWSGQMYYMYYTGSQPPPGEYVEVRTVGNIVEQTDTIHAVFSLIDAIQTNQYGVGYIKGFKVLLGIAGNKPVKMDKIVIYSRIPKRVQSIRQEIRTQIDLLGFYCAGADPLPKFVMRPDADAAVGYGEGIPYNGQEMAFSEPRSVCVKNALDAASAAHHPIKLHEFAELLSHQFKLIGLSENIPFINKCSRGEEQKWI